MLGWGREKKEVHEPERTPSHASVHVPPVAASPSAVPHPVQEASAVTPPPAKTLEELLVETGTISIEQLEAAKAKQQQSGEFLGQILVDMHCIEDDSLTSFLAKHCRIPHLSLLDYLIDETILKLVPKEICRDYCLLPIDRLGRNLTIAMVNPLDTKALELVRQACPELRIKPILCAYNHYETVSRKLFGGEGKKSAELSATSLGLLMPKPKIAAPPTVSETEISIVPPVSTAPADALIEPPPPAPVPTPPVPPMPAPKTPLNSDTLLETIFGQMPVAPRETVEPAPPTPAPPPSAESEMGSSVIIREMLSVMQDSMYDTYAVLARRMDLFHGLAAGDVAKIFAKGVTREFEAGETIFRKGDAGSELYVVLSGKVEIRDNGCALAILEKGDMFGEMALSGHQTRSASALAAETTSALVLSNNIIHNVLGKDAAIQILENIVMTLSARVRAANQRMTQAGLQP